jgi:hypothetical protein
LESVLLLYMLAVVTVGRDRRRPNRDRHRLPARHVGSGYARVREGY